MTAFLSSPTVPAIRRVTRSEQELNTYFEQVLSFGCTKSFSSLFNKKYNALCLYAQKIVDSHELAEEVVSDVFVKLWKNRQQIEINFSYKAYLYRAVRNQAYDYVKSKSFSNSQMTNSIEADPTAFDFVADSLEKQLEGKELQKIVDKAVEELPRQCRIIFKMSREEQLKYAEIAERMGLSVKTIETQMGRALKQLRSSLAAYR